MKTPITEQAIEQWVDGASTQSTLIKTARRLELDRAALMEALEQLAKLGNGDKYGNSIGNEIAQRALSAARANFPDEN